MTALNMHNNDDKAGLQHQNPHLCIRHFLNLVHGFTEINALDGLVNNAMSHGQDGFIRICYLQPGKEIPCPTLQLFEAFDVVGPRLVLQIRNLFTRKTAPVALA